MQKLSFRNSILISSAVEQKELSARVKKILTLNLTKIHKVLHLISSTLVIVYNTLVLYNTLTCI